MLIEACKPSCEHWSAKLHRCEIKLKQLGGADPEKSCVNYILIYLKDVPPPRLCIMCRWMCEPIDINQSSRIKKCRMVLMKYYILFTFEYRFT